ncbi:hypothetical protein M378DRAFT_198590 [Amanita muscaria Koide BX008]|uniref:Uncharacterized protein n=1 Tax=Amanita muscaria (strain Koide BX008) TaxID=946122 RepID=A0A0C2WQU0_AMAMK|nr:hypothetical protein M378DRAFT_198590 [Amanita muscaria Koide BX008]
MTAISHPTKPKKGTNVGTLSSDSRPAPLEGDSTTESHTAADTPKVPQHALDRVGPLQSSAGLDTTAKSQKEPKSTEPKKTLVNVDTASDEPPPASPERVEVEKSTTESEADASIQSSTGLDITVSQKELRSTELEKPLVNDVGTASSESPPAPPKQVEEVHDSTTGSHSGADASTQSSTGLNTTPVSQKALHTIEPERTQTNTTDVDTPLLAKISDSLKTQCTTSNIDVSAQDSHLIRSSEVVKDGTVSNLPSQKKQKASDPAQVEDGHATTPSMEEDAVNQRMAKYEEAIRGLKAKLLSMETFASQQAGNRREEIERLESKISGMKETVDQQKQEYKEEIESFKKAIVADMGQETPKDIGRLEGKHEKEVQRLEAIVVDTDKQTSKEIERLERKHEKVIQRLEASVADMDKQAPKEIERLEGKHEKAIQRLEAIVFDIDKQASKEIERLERKHEKDIQRLEAIVVDMDKQTSKEIERLERKHEKDIQRLEAIVVDMGKQGLKEIERSQPKVFIEEDAKQPKTKELQTRGSTV